MVPSSFTGIGSILFININKLFRYEHEHSIIIHLDHRLVIKLNEWIDVKQVDDAKCKADVTILG